MFSVSKILAVVVTIAISTLACASPQELWVCADHNNLPYSNDRQEGFENKIAQLLAQDLGRKLQYVWWPSSPMFASKIFKRGACDIIMGVPSKAYDLAEPTQPYYSSTFVFVSRRDRKLEIHSFDDPILRNIRIAVPVVDDGATPAEQELAQRGIVRNVIGYTPFGDLSKDSQPAELIAAVARSDVDVAIAWGPLAGYFAQRSSVPLKLTPICAPTEPRSLPQRFSISVGVRHGEDELRQQIDAELTHRHAEIRALLESYGIPLVEPDSSPEACK